MTGSGCRMAADAGAQVTELADEDHACLTFGEPEELAGQLEASRREGFPGLQVAVDMTALAFIVACCSLMNADPGPSPPPCTRWQPTRCCTARGTAASGCGPRTGSCTVRSATPARPRGKPRHPAPGSTVARRARPRLVNSHPGRRPLLHRSRPGRHHRHRPLRPQPDPALSPPQLSSQATHSKQPICAVPGITPARSPATAGPARTPPVRC